MLQGEPLIEDQSWEYGSALSIAASVVALRTAGDAAYKIAKSLYRSSRRAKGAGRDIENFAKDVDMYGVAIGAAYAALETNLNLNPPTFTCN